MSSRPRAPGERAALSGRRRRAGGRPSRTSSSTGRSHERPLDRVRPAAGRRLPGLAADDDLRAVVLSSSTPRAFCVGADLKERNGYTDEQLRAQRVVYRRMAAALLAVPVPVVAAVAGFALGGGLELALLGDLVVADETAVVGLPEVSVGVIPGLGGTQLLPRRIGAARAAELIFTARQIDAAEAAALGVVDRVVPAGQAAGRIRDRRRRSRGTRRSAYGTPSGRSAWVRARSSRRSVPAPSRIARLALRTADRRVAGDRRGDSCAVAAAAPAGTTRSTTPSAPASVASSRRAV